MDFSLLMCDIQHCLICRPLDSTVSEDAGIEPKAVATTALAVRRSNHSARYHPEKIQEMLVMATVAMHVESVGIGCIIGDCYVTMIMVVAAAVI